MKLNTRTLKKWAKEIVITMVICLVIYSVINTWRQAEMPAQTPLHWQDIHHQSIDLHQISQQEATLIYFWATWCHICRYSTPTVQQLAHTTPIVTVAVQSGNSHEIQQYLKQHHYYLTTINDEHGELFQQWQGQVTPSYVIIKEGQVHQSFVGLQPLWLLKLRLYWANLM